MRNVRGVAPPGEVQCAGVCVDGCLDGGVDGSGGLGQEGKGQAESGIYSGAGRGEARDIRPTPL